MGTTERKPHPALIERLAREPGAFDFFRAVQVLEAAARGRTHGPTRPVGHDHPPSEVGIRFRAAPSLAHPARPVVSVESDGEAGPEVADVVVSFLGLIGPAGTLPTHYTEIVLQRLHAKDRSLRDFLDALQDRSIGLFYRAWGKYRMPAAWAASEPGSGDIDPITTTLLALAGLLPRPRGKALGAGELGQVHHTGLFSDRRRSAHGLCAMLRGILGCDVEVAQFVGQWIDLDRDAWSRLGGTGRGVQARLGEETVLGARVWSVDARIRVVAGPLDRERFRALWPGGAPVRYVREMMRAYLGPLIDFDLVWELDPAAPAPIALGGDSRLGRDGWLGWSENGAPDLRVASPAWHNPHPGDSTPPGRDDPAPSPADRRAARPRPVS